ncbi:hypothetical protein [Agrococcus baldri]|uniref:Transporter n=1 Tax=Agrococcus baldri TaxID=153730 RepID=A0AA87REE4_9MICO|nr:hypothetical protein [Agrococcus baldri]GEK79254.1 hypothetical protein ABA31_06050 [Agrococcus baldri]
MNANQDTTPLPEDEQALDPRAMAELMAAQRTTVQRSQSRGVRIILGGWAFAWIVGFLALWSGTAGGNPLFTLPGGLEWWIFGAAMAVGVIVATVTGTRMGRGVQGQSTTAGKLYGLAAAASFVAMWLFISALRRHVEIDAETAALLYVGAFVLTVGVVYAVGSAMSRSWAQFFFGLAILLLAIGATLLGAPHHLLLYALVGGGLMLAFTWMLGRSVAAGPGA